MWRLDLDWQECLRDALDQRWLFLCSCLELAFVSPKKRVLCVCGGCFYFVGKFLQLCLVVSSSCVLWGEGGGAGAWVRFVGFFVGVGLGWGWVA